MMTGRAKGRAQTKACGDMAVITLPNGCTITTDAGKAQRFEHELQELDLVPQSGTQYIYEDVDGTTIPVTFEGWDNLNLVLGKQDGSIKRVPVIDMGDGSLVTDWLRRIPMTDIEFCSFQTQRIARRLSDSGFSSDACNSVRVVPEGGRFKVALKNVPAAEVERLLATLVADGLVTEPVIMSQKQGLTGNYGMN